MLSAASKTRKDLGGPLLRSEAQGADNGVHRCAVTAGASSVDIGKARRQEAGCVNVDSLAAVFASLCRAWMSSGGGCRKEEARRSG